MATSPFETFLHVTDPLRAACRSVEIAAVLLRRDDGWRVLSARIVVWPWPKAEASNVAVDLGAVQAMSIVTLPAVLPSLVDGLRNQTLKLPGWKHGSAPRLSSLPDSNFRDSLDVR